MAVAEGIVGHASGPPDLDDPMGPQQTEGVGCGRLAHTRGDRQIADAELSAFEQAGDEPQPSGVRQEAEDLGQLLDRVGLGKAPLDGGDPLAVHDPDVAGIQR